MSRTARRWEPGAIYHVDARAHDGAPIFAMDEDRAFVVERAATVFAECGVVCLAWSVLVNHYHMLLRCDAPPGRAIQRLNTAIARRVRLRSGGAGAVFQGRFFSGICTDEAAVLTRLAYVTANPVHHRIVGSVAALAVYPWSSLGEMTGRRDARLAIPSAALALLPSPPELACASLIDLLEVQVRAWAERDAEQAGARHPDVDAPPEPTIKLARRVTDEVGAPRSLGAVSGRTPPVSPPWETVCARRETLRGAGWSPADLARPACSLIGADVAALRAGNRRRGVSRARAIVAHVACDHLAWPTDEVAAAVGVSNSAVVQARTRGAALLAAAGVSATELLRQSGAGAGNCSS